jgi:hypothetical protein
MSSVARQSGRTRRAEQGTVTEMARLLLRDAREAAAAQLARAEAESGRGPEHQASPRLRRPARGATSRLRPLPLAARRA